MVPFQCHGNSPISELSSIEALIACDAPPKSLKDSNASLKVKTTKEEGVRVCFLSSQHFWGKKGVLKLWDGDYNE
jgi:hypothetical protein